MVMVPTSPNDDLMEGSGENMPLMDEEMNKLGRSKQGEDDKLETEYSGGNILVISTTTCIRESMQGREANWSNSDRGVELPFYASFVYAKCTRFERVLLCNCLRSLVMGIQLPWIVDGDFNVILNRDERLFGAELHGGAMENFATTLLDCGLIDGGFEGNSFTWTNNQESFWKQKLGIKWLVEGECNTKFFHMGVKKKRIKSHIFKIQNSDGSWVDNPDLVKASAVEFFSSLMKSEPNEMASEIFISRLECLVCPISFHLVFFGMFNATWNKITLPSSEGGLDIKGLEDVFEAFSMKLWWKFQTCNNIWSKFMRAKYCYGRIPGYTQPKRHDSQMWKRMLACYLVTEQHMRWKIGKGELFFWYDCWMGDEPLINRFPVFSSSMTQVCYFFNNNEWDVDKLNTMLPEEMVVEILKIPFNTSSTDVAYWVPTSDGDFTTKSAWEIIRQRDLVNSVFNLIWHRCIPLTTSFFLWRLLQNWSPVDLRLKIKGFQLASKCQYCNS
ncbi:Uncharacterized protein TCM_008287 [Theobroma cacao]|uniref:Reverse transcriptase zinc-binding domain-containing protein n=1 Tax=Theobroma cacao TaxID=3641 RepID=A0A061EBA3_THECC|nr:Uncharacterized protein TCM_008287 [Theobroma cacao]